MLRKCSSALLLTNIVSFAHFCTECAEELNVSLRVESEWNYNFRVTEEVILCGSKYLDVINEKFYSKVVLILKDIEIPFPFMQKGITRFVFNYNNRVEIMYSFYNQEKIYVNQENESVKSVLDTVHTLVFKKGEYDFDFGKDRFYFQNKGIYLTNAEKVYLANWLLSGKKDNKQRGLLCRLRKKFGDMFLDNVDRYGQLKEANNE